MGQYARRFRFSQEDHDDTSGRLQQILRLLKQHHAASSEELLGRAAEAEAQLDHWFQMEGVPPPKSVGFRYLIPLEQRNPIAQCISRLKRK